MRHGLRRQVDGRHESVEGGRAHPATSGRGWRSRPWHWRLSNRTTIFSGTSARPWAQAASTPGRTGYRHQERHRPEVGAIAGRLPAGAGSTARPSPEDVAHSASNIYQLQPSAFRTTWVIVGWKAVGDDGPAELATVWANGLDNSRCRCWLRRAARADRASKPRRISHSANADEDAWFIG
jgi:hypothetical protein